MRHQHVRREAAIDLDAEMARRGTQIFLARLAGCAFAAADPGKHGSRGAGLHVRIGAGFLDHPRNLVSEGEGEGA